MLDLHNLYFKLKACEVAEFYRVSKKFDNLDDQIFLSIRKGIDNRFALQKRLNIGLEMLELRLNRLVKEGLIIKRKSLSITNKGTKVTFLTN